MTTHYPCDRCNMDEGSPICLRDGRCPAMAERAAPTGYTKTWSEAVAGLSGQAAYDQSEGGLVARPLVEWHEDMGAVLWWAPPVNEPPWCGQPTDSDWPHYHTHWTPLVVPHVWA